MSDADTKPSLRIAVVGIPGKWSTEVLADALEARTSFRLVVDMAEVALDLSSGALHYRGHNLCELDGIAIKKISAEYSANTLNRLELLRIAEARGVRIFSSTKSILGLVNRLSCTVSLRNANIPMPATCITEDVDEALVAIHRFGSAVMKPLFSTKARGMTVISADAPESEVAARLNAFREQNPTMYIQQKLNLPGKDLGMVFLGGNYLGCYARVGDGGSWNTTIHSGGRYASFDAPQEYIDIAQRAQAAFSLDFTTVDLAETDTGPVVFEVSAFGGFRGALDGAGIDAATLYCDYIIKQLG